MSYRYVSPTPWFTNAYAGRRTNSVDRVRRQVSLKGSHPSEAKELGGGSASINGEFRALDETRALCREEDNGFAKSKPPSPAVNTTSPRAARLGVHHLITAVSSTRLLTGEAARIVNFAIVEEISAVLSQMRTEAAR